MIKKFSIGTTIILIVTLVYLVMKANICSIETGWIGQVQECTCKGYELQIKNDLPVDGSKITVCLGVISSTSEYSHSEYKYSTPELINNDYITGKITLEQKWIYMMYAFQDYEQIPDEYQGNIGWDGTSYLLDFEELVRNDVVCTFSQEAIRKLEDGFSRDLNCPHGY